MFYSRYPSEWEPEFDNHGNVINDIEPVRPEATIFLKSSLQGDFLKDKGTMKQISLRIPESTFYDIEALAEVGSLSRNAVILALISSGKELLNDQIGNNTRQELNKICRDLERKDWEKAKEKTEEQEQEQGE